MDDISFSISRRQADIGVLDSLIPFSKTVFALYASSGQYDYESGGTVYWLLAILRHTQEKPLIRFLDTEFFHTAFPAKMLETALSIPTQPPISFDTVLEDFRCSISSVPVETSKSLPLVSDSDPYSLEDEFRHILFSQPPISRLQESAVEKFLDIERATGFESAEPPVLNILIDRSWVSDMAVRWISAIVFPNYPNFSAYAEKTRFVQKILDRQKEFCQDKDSILHAFLAMYEAAKLSPVVTPSQTISEKTNRACSVSTWRFRPAHVI